MNNGEKNFVSAVVYVHDAEKQIGVFLSRLIEVMETNFEHSEIICVNDSSQDNSIDIIRELGKNCQQTSISVVNLSFFHGLELAMNAGNDLAIGDFVFEFDSPYMDYETDLIMRIYRRALEGYDVVSAVPDVREKWTSRIFYKIFDRFAHMPYQMESESFRILSRRVINRVASMNKTVPYRKAVYAGSGLKMDKLRYQVKNREKGRGKHKETGYRMNLAVDSLILFTEIGYRISFFMTFLMMFVSLSMVIYSIIIYMTAHPVEGWTTTILFLSIAFLGVFAVLTMVVKYLQLLVSLIFKRKGYSFESIEKISQS